MLYEINRTHLVWHPQFVISAMVHFLFILRLQRETASSSGFLFYHRFQFVLLKKQTVLPTFVKFAYSLTDGTRAFFLLIEWES